MSKEYDAEDLYISPTELPQTRELADAILEYLEVARDVDKEAMPKDDPSIGFRVQREILDSVGRQHIRFFDVAMSLLVDTVERKDGIRTMYRRHDLRRAKQDTGTNEEMFAKTPIKKNLMPYGAMTRGRK